MRFDPTGDCAIEDTGGGPFFHYWTQNFGTRSGVYPLVIEREAWQTSSTVVDVYVYGQGQFQEMRFSNDGATWSPWEPFSPTTAWSLGPSPGSTPTVYVQLRIGTTVRQASDTIRFTGTACTGEAVLILSSLTITGTRTHTACEEIRASHGFRVGATGDVTFQAPTVVLEDGFSVASGASFTAATP